MYAREEKVSMSYISIEILDGMDEEIAFGDSYI